jgi:hypothetical protein
MPFGNASSACLPNFADLPARFRELAVRLSWNPDVGALSNGIRKQFEFVPLRGQPTPLHFVLTLFFFSCDTFFAPNTE